MAKPYLGPVIDPHHHLWDLALGCHPWLAATAGETGGLGDLTPIRRNYLPDDYAQDAARQNIVASVHIEAVWTAQDPMGETRWLDTLDKSRGVAARTVARVALDEPGAEALLEAQASHARVVGVRDILSWHPDRRFAASGTRMDDPAWRAGLAALRRHDFVFDLMVFPNQFGDALRLARDFPDQVFVLNHCGSPFERDTQGMRRWRDGLKALAEAPNVCIKISDLVAYDNHWTEDSLRPVVEHCIESFGPSRCLFASDFPVAGLHATFDEIYDGFRLFAAEYSESEQAAMFYGNALRLYRLEETVDGKVR